MLAADRLGGRGSEAPLVGIGLGERNGHRMEFTRLRRSGRSDRGRIHTAPDRKTARGTSAIK